MGAGAALALVAGGVVAFVATRGGDDEVVATTVTVPDSTSTTVADTLVITVPETTVVDTQPPVPTAVAGDVLVSDDTGLFSLSVPESFETDTTSLDVNGVRVPSVTSAVQLSTYDEGYDEIGFTVAALPPDLAVTEDEAIQFGTPPSEDCVTIDRQPDLDTDIGPAAMVLAEGCGINGATVVVLVLADEVSGHVFVVGAQGLAGATEVTTLARAVLEGIYIN
ncbi:MAG: hypothetical protein RI900_1117 [Actinomycetota bacterium]